MQAFTAKYIFDGTKLVDNHVVVIDNGIIHNVLPSVKFSGKVENLGNGVIAPGFIDLQLNGCGGVLFNDDISTNTLETMYQTWLKFGTTGFLPTLITSDFKDVIKSLNVTRDWFAKFGNKRGVLGLHLEGPFISVIKRGIHPERFIIDPTMELLEQIVSFKQYFPIKMTIAVEKFTVEQIKYLVDNGIIVSIGHCNADCATVEASIRHGVSTATHIFNAMSGLTGRNPGAIGAILNTDIYAGVIVDMLHVDSANIRLLEKIKKEQVYLVTDAVTPTGTEMTEFDFAEKHLYVKDGKCIDKDGVLGGAYLTMNDAVKNCVTQCGLTLEQSLAMASTIPARVMGLDGVIGRVTVGARNNLIYMDLDNFTCKVLG
jgi:N-acetylglucosamine-6-phosphate deacetylase